MIINIRGTSGSGKSTIVRSIMNMFPTWEPDYVLGKTRPKGYTCKKPDRAKALYIVGHYEILCGGADTISDLVEQFDRVRMAHEQGHDVLCEGLFMSGDVKRTLELHTLGIDILVLGIKRSFDKCYDDANRRKKQVAESYGRLFTDNYSYKNVWNKHRGVYSSMQKLEAHGVRCEWHTREGCFRRIRMELGL